LVIDDERAIRRILRLTLESNSFTVLEAETAKDGLYQAATEHPDAIILDLALPDADGLEVLRQIREWSKVPVIILSVRDEEKEKVQALETGADDYVTKPFSPRELRARIKAVLRRFGDESLGVYRFGDVELDFDRAEVRKNGKPVDLTALELRLLKVLVQRRGRVLSRGQLIEAAWDPGTYVSDRVVDTHVLNLRKKIEPVPERPRFICGMRGIGYRFDG
jgi:two-component system KDP operon response regulator KdpE